MILQDSQVNLLGVRYHNLTIEEALKSVIDILENGCDANIFFLNADCVRRAQKDIEYKRALENADLVLSDGIGLQVLTTIYGQKMRDNCNGTDLSPVIIKECAKRGYSIFFLGAKPGIAEKAANNVRINMPEVNIVGTCDGYFKDSIKTINDINAKKPDVLFVAMGVPLQEKWIMRNRNSLNVKVCLGVGAFFDYLSDSIPRAPQWMIKFKIEWFWRIFIEPKRMFKRYIIDGIGFMIWAIFKKFSNR